MPDTPAPEPGDSLFAVLVLYRQTLEQSVSFRSLRAASSGATSPVHLLVYDNSPTPPGDPAPRYPGWEIHYLHDPSNAGISRAYQEGARLAVQHSRSWLLLLDQDTRFPRDALDRYLDAIRSHPDVRLFAPVLRSAGRIMSPCRYHFRLGFPLSRIARGRQSLTGRSVLNSGMCVAVEDYLAAGGHDTRLPLDFADHEFVERFKQRHHTFVVVDVECDHDFAGAAVQTTASQLARFQHYCRGAKYSGKGVMGAILTAGIVGGRACLLSLRHRNMGFLRVAAGTLLGGRSP
jgi:rhamnosyltransferase